MVQESIVVIKDIFRRYPYRYETALTDLCEHLESLDEPEARAAMIWIVGEYSDRIDNAEELLAMFLEVSYILHLWAGESWWRFDRFVLYIRSANCLG